jgi:hypothetical protein
MTFGTPQPIDKAPKDGTRILVFGRYFEGCQPYWTIASWQKEAVKDTFEPIGDGTYRKVRKAKEGWSGDFVATRWMPLPDDPPVETPALSFVQSEAKL